MLFFQPVPDIVQPLAFVLEVARADDGVFITGEKLGQGRKSIYDYRD